MFMDAIFVIYLPELHTKNKGFIKQHCVTGTKTDRHKGFIKQHCVTGTKTDMHSMLNSGSLGQVLLFFAFARPTPW
jgi:hypothetical protein